MLTCQQIPEALQNKDLSFTQKLSLRFHLFICTRCLALSQQFKAIDQMLEMKKKSTKPVSPELVNKIKFDYLKKD